RHLETPDHRPRRGARRAAPAGGDAVSESARIPVRGAGDYDVVVGRDLGAELLPALGERVRKALVVHQPAQAQRAEAIRERLRGTVEVLLAEVPDAEEAKRVEVAAFCWQVLG